MNIDRFHNSLLKTFSIPNKYFCRFHRSHEADASGSQQDLNKKHIFSHPHSVLIQSYKAVHI